MDARYQRAVMELALEWKARGFDVQAVVPPFRQPDPVAGVVPAVRATAPGRDVIVIVGRRRRGEAPLLRRALHLALCDWTLASPERELYWVIRDAATGVIAPPLATARIRTPSTARTRR